MDTKLKHSPCAPPCMWGLTWAVRGVQRGSGRQNRGKERLHGCNKNEQIETWDKSVKCIIVFITVLYSYSLLIQQYLKVLDLLMTDSCNDQNMTKLKLITSITFAITSNNNNNNTNTNSRKVKWTLLFRTVLFVTIRNLLFSWSNKCCKVI